MRVEAGGQTIEVPVKQLPLFGSVSQEVGVPDAPEPHGGEGHGQVGGRSKTATVTIVPQRKWRIFVAPSSHTDIGYTDIQPKCAERHNENIDAAIELCAKYPDFRWNLEVAWQAENYLDSRKGEQLERFPARWPRKGGSACRPSTATSSPGSARTRRPAGSASSPMACSREHGSPTRSAMISDVPTQEASLPMLLAGSGIRYFSSGINNTRASPSPRCTTSAPAGGKAPTAAAC